MIGFCFVLPQGTTEQAAIDDLQSKAEETLEFCLERFSSVRLPCATETINAGILLDELGLPTSTPFKTDSFVVFQT